jgi:hypothetical protein
MSSALGGTKNKRSPAESGPTCQGAFHNFFLRQGYGLGWFGSLLPKLNYFYVCACVCVFAQIKRSSIFGAVPPPNSSTGKGKGKNKGFCLPFTSYSQGLRCDCVARFSEVLVSFVSYLQERGAVGQ